MKLSSLLLELYDTQIRDYLLKGGVLKTMLLDITFL